MTTSAPRRKSVGCSGSIAPAAPATKRPKVDVPKSEGPLPNANDKHLTKVAENFEKMLSHPVFQDILDAEPVEINIGEGENSGHEACYDFGAYKTAICEKGRYKAAFNVMTIDFMFSPSSKVKIRRSGVALLKKQYFMTADYYPGEEMIAVADGETDINTLRGKLRSVSPPEKRDALLERICEAIDANESDEELQKWRTVCLSTTFHFQLLVNKDEITALGMQLREYLVTEYKAMARTGAQWVMQVMTIKVDSGLQTAQQVADHINGTVQVAEHDRDDSGKNNDKISVNFVQMCMDVYQTLISDEVARAVIDDGEEQWGVASPFNNVSSLDIIGKKGRSGRNPNWAILSIYDAVKSGVYSAGSFTKISLKGESHQRGFIDLFNRKDDMRIHLLGPVLNEYDWEQSVVAKVRDMYSSHESYRKLFGYPSDKTIPGVMASWPTSLVNFCKVVEETAFGKEYDSSIRYGLRLRKDESEILQLDRYVEAFEQIDEDVKAEMEKQTEVDKHRESAGANNDNAGDGGNRTEQMNDNDEDGHLQMLVENPEKLDEETKEELERHREAAQRYCSVLRLGPEPKNATTLGVEVADWLGCLRGDGGTLEGITVVWYNTPTVGECVANPRVRKPPLRAHYNMFMTGVLEGLGVVNELPDNVAFVIFNGGKDGERESKTSYI